MKTPNRDDEATSKYTRSLSFTIEARLKILRRMITKRKLFVRVPSHLKTLDDDDIDKLNQPLSGSRRDTLQRAQQSPRILSRHIIDSSELPSNITTPICHPPLKHRYARELPKSLTIMYCGACKRISHTGKNGRWIQALSEPDKLHDFLIGRIKFYIYHRQFLLIDSWTVQPGPDDDPASIIKIGLKLGFQDAITGDCEKLWEVAYKIANQNCSDCSFLIDESQLNSVVQLRQNANIRGILRALTVSILENKAFNIQKSKHTREGVDFFFRNDSDALPLLNFLASQPPVRCNPSEKRIMPGESGSKNDSTARCVSVTTAVVCPMFIHDLVYLPAEVLAALGLLRMGRLAICLDVISSICLLDPLSARRVVVSFKDYWRVPFVPLRSRKDLVEYKILDVKIVSSEGLYSMADVQVARVSDTNDTAISVRTHLGHNLKPGDHAFGYDLHGLNIIDDGIVNKEHTVHDVILVKKNLSPKKRSQSALKEKSLEYVQFLRELESNPDALFNLSLNDGDAQKQNAEISEAKLDNVGLELEDLLADLALNDH